MGCPNSAAVHGIHSRRVRADAYDREFVTALNADYLIPEFANTMSLPRRWRVPIATAVMEAYERVFLGDADADAVGIRHRRIARLLPRISGVMQLISRGQIRRAGGLDEFTRRAYADRDTEMARMRAAYAMTHDMVDTAPDRLSV